MPWKRQALCNHQKKKGGRLKKKTMLCRCYFCRRCPPFVSHHSNRFCSRLASRCLFFFCVFSVFILLCTVWTIALSLHLIYCNYSHSDFDSSTLCRGCTWPASVIAPAVFLMLAVVVRLACSLSSPLFLFWSACECSDSLVGLVCTRVRALVLHSLPLA